jgi:hypothetical protein
MNNTIPALQSMIARNRNELSSTYTEIAFARECLSSYKCGVPSIPLMINYLRKYQKYGKIIEANQKALKHLLAKEYAEERIRAFNKEYQLMRNK